MLLRRITEHVRAQNWFAVFLDFVIVVVGVFVGIQLGNWNAAQADTRLGDSYLDRIIVDLRGDYDIAQVQANYYQTVLDSVQKAEELLDDPASPARDLVVAAYRASEISNNPVNRATWDQMVASGHLGLLPERAIESGLADYYRFAEANVLNDTLLQESPYRRTVRSLFPTYVQAAIRAGCSDAYDEIQVVTGFVAECRLDVDDDVLADLAADLRGSTALRSDLRSQFSLITTVYLTEVGNLALLQQALDALDTEKRE